MITHLIDRFTIKQRSHLIVEYEVFWVWPWLFRLSSLLGSFLQFIQKNWFMKVITAQVSILKRKKVNTWTLKRNANKKGLFSVEPKADNYEYYLSQGYEQRSWIFVKISQKIRIHCPHSPAPLSIPLIIRVRRGPGESLYQRLFLIVGSPKIMKTRSEIYRNQFCYNSVCICQLH